MAIGNPYRAATPVGVSPRRRRLPPARELLVIASGAVALVVVAALLALSAPWLGLTLVPGSQPVGLRVAQVSEASPNAQRVRPGMVIVALETATGTRIPLYGDLLLEEPDLLDFGAFNAFLRTQDAISDALKRGGVSAVTAGGKRIPLHSRGPPWRQFAGYFAAHVVYGLIALLVATGIWVFRRHDRAAQCFALSGVAVFVTTLTLAVYGGRELALDGALFRALSALNHLATLLTCAALAALFWVYPRRLGRTPVPTALIAIALVVWCADQFQVGPGARVTLYLPVLVGYLAGLAFAAAQWRATRGRPLDRAALKWCVIAIALGSLLLMGLIMIPPVFGAAPLVPLVVGFAAYLILYLGIAAGLVRYRLFDIERWWFGVWLWFAGGLTVLALDALMVWGLDMTLEGALVPSLAIAGWAYFPLRQWLWRRFGQRPQVPVEAAMQQLVDKLFSAGTDGQIRAAWPKLLQRSFSPLRLDSDSAGVAAVAVSGDGAALRVPPLSPGHDTLVLAFPANGARLFTPEDVRVATLLFDLTANALRAVQARQAGAEAERGRIMRDLHDDLGARLLSLVYAADNDPAQALARAALDDLHGVIDATSGQSVDLPEVAAKTQAEIRSRMHQAGLQLDWTVDAALPAKRVSARAATNITRILREAVSNVIRHAGADRVSIRWQYTAAGIVVEVEDDGAAGDPAGWPTGGGTRTIRTRVDDLAGRVAWRSRAGGGNVLRLELPL